MVWSQRRALLALLAILAAYALLLGRAARYELVWDDVREIQLNDAFDRPLLEGLGKTQTARTDPALAELTTIELAYDSYRPLLFASLWIDIQIWGRSSVALHLGNLLLGAIAILLAYALARRWLGPSLALLPTAMFALHPIQIEAVAYISGRGDVLAGLFALLALLAGGRALDAVTGPRARAWAGLGAVSYAASLLSKEAYIALPIAVAAIALMEGTLRRRWWIPTLLAVVSVGYLGLRAAVVASTTGHAMREGVVGLPGVWLEYLRIVALPFDLSTERLRHSAYVIPGALLAAAAVIIIAIAARRHSLSRHARTAVVGLVIMCLLVAPAAIPIVSMNVVADRYFYLPLFGLALAITAGGAQLATVNARLVRGVAAIGIVEALLWLVVAWRQVPVWQSNESLYHHAVALSPESAMAHYRVGYLEAQADRWPEAIARFERAIELDPRNIVALNNLGVGYMQASQWADATRVLSTATEVSPAHFRAWLNLGLSQCPRATASEAARASRAPFRLTRPIPPRSESYERGVRRADADRLTSAGGRCSP